MFQSFDNISDPSKGRARLAALRQRLKAAGLDGFIVPRADEHQGEYVPANAERLAWLTGFTGSAGTAVVLPDRAAIFIDGRYTVQVRHQVDTGLFEPVSVLDKSPAEWLGENAPENARIGFDPWLVTRGQARLIEQALEGKGELIAVEDNPLDQAWTDRPPPPQAQVSLQPDELTGTARQDKLKLLSESLDKANADAAILSDPASVAWAFNIRGSDVPHTPLPLSFAILNRDGRPSLFIDGCKLSNSVRDELQADIDVEERDRFEDALASLGRAGKTVLFDPALSADAIARIVEAAGGEIIEGRDPAALPRSRKSAAELAGSRKAHIRDGAAMLRFLVWFDAEAPGGALTEIDAARKLEEFRIRAGNEDGMPLADISFDTISAAGPNGAIVHYRVSEQTNRTVENGDLFLLDSGGQYRDGTTDITRTLLVGTPEPERLELYRDRFTRVLKGHIALARTRFPKGTNGAQLDVLARQVLWQAGLDFDHGTGHGVGSYLSVHEGPQRIAKTGTVALEPGMIISNEPGFYVQDEFGIRIENLIVVRDATSVPGGNREMLSFETITLAPIDRRLIAPSLLSPAERAWLDCYHARVHGTLSGWPGLGEPERTWLAAACRPITA
ncbi:MAG TPA: aminopeptidase P family protein [Afifellaceae bacterium]|nr:aminopeptidase P family protein [Afifellaceae bacterium]